MAEQKTTLKNPNASLQRHHASIITPAFSKSNRDFAEQNKHFQKMCEKAGVPATKRQASKFRNKRGAAFRQHKGKLSAKHLE